jgi:anti-sigma B factor antagonist
VILDFKKRALQPGMAVLEMRGSIHCGPECARLEREVDVLIADRQTLVIFDMTGVTHADSAAIGSIVRCLTKLKRAGGGLRIAGAQDMIDHSLKLTKVDRLIQMLPTVDQAASGFAAQQEGPQL